jgi:SAM-dependent methyltransferase
VTTPTSHSPSADPLYASGRYFADPSRHAGDASFKASTFVALLRHTIDLATWPVHSYADVGSGSGDAARLVARGLRDAGAPLASAKGYDVSPHVQYLTPADGVEFVNADFGNDGEYVDLVTLFDVIEHVPEPAEFLRRVARRCRIIGLHIPLDDSINVAVRDLFKSKVKDPGHITFMDGVTALNLLAGAGLRVLDYQYTMSFDAPSGRFSLASKVVSPLRKLLARISPWLLSKTLGGASLMVIALTADGMRFDQERRS